MSILIVSSNTLPQMRWNQDKRHFFLFCMQKHGTPIVPAAEDVIGTHLHVTVLNKEKWQQFFPFVAEEKCPLGLWAVSVIFGQVWLYETRRGKKCFSHRLVTRIGKLFLFIYLFFIICYSFVHCWEAGSTSNIQFPCSSCSFLLQTGTCLSVYGWVFVNYKGYFLCISCLWLIVTIF